MTKPRRPTRSFRPPGGLRLAPPHPGRALLAIAVPIALAAGAARAPAHQAPHRAPEASAAFELPQAGTYELPPIARVGEFELLNRGGELERLPGLAPDQVALIAFIYTRCPDGHGCPSVLATQQRIDRLLAADAKLAARVRQFAISFDPAHDTPERMDALARSLRPRADWRFCTPASVAHLEPLLEAFGQDALPLVSESGAKLGLYRHVLKVFLVDARGAVRNVYSAGFLSPELLLVDAETVLLEQAAPEATPP